MARIDFRQGIVRHQTDGSNNPTFLQKVGQNVNLVVSPDFTTVNFIHGNKDYLFTESVTITNAWTGLPLATDAWLYWDINKTTGIRTFGFTTLAPITQSSSPISPLVGQMWFNTNANMWYEYNGASFVEKIRVFAAKLAGGNVFESMSANTPLFTGTQIGNTTTVNVGSLVFDSTGNPIINQDGKFFTTEDVFTSGVPTGASLKVNNILVRAQAQEPIAPYQVVNFSDYDKILLANPFDAVITVYGIVDQAVPTGDMANVITEGVIFNAAWDWDNIGGTINDPVYIDATGQITIAQNIPNQVPVGAIIGKQEILFKPGIYGYGGISAGPIDHATLLGLTGDDHLQYHTDARGDARYSPLGHQHLKIDITDFNDADYATAAQGILADSAVQLGDNISVLINDAGYLTAETDPVFLSQKAQPNGVATLDAGGVIPSIQLPPIAITDTFVVADLASRISLTAQIGDVAVQQDVNESFILQIDDPTVDGNWVKLLTPTDAVLSVNAQTGVVALTTDDIPEGTNLYYTDIRVSANTDVNNNTAHVADVTTNPHNVTAAQTGAELSLGNPIVDGEVLSSTVAGVRSWVTLPTGVTVISDLTDVDTTVDGGPNTGDVLTFTSGGVWSQTTLTLGSLSDVSNTLTPLKGSILSHNGTQWIDVGVGTDGQVLTASTAAAAGVNWAAATGGLQNIVEDLTPQLGGNLDVNGFNIVTIDTTNINSNTITIQPGTSNLTAGDIILSAGDGVASLANGIGGFIKLTAGADAVIEGTPKTIQILSPDTTNGTGNVGGGIIELFNVANTQSSLLLAAPNLANNTNFILPPDNGTNGFVLQTNGAGTTTWAAATGGLQNIVEDLTPQLGGNLDVNGFNIVTIDTVESLAGTVTVKAGDANGNSGGGIDIISGSNTSTTSAGVGGTINITAGDSAYTGFGASVGANVVITAGSAAAGLSQPGNVVLESGNSAVGPGTVRIQGPGDTVAGQLAISDGSGNQTIVTVPPLAVDTSFVLPPDNGTNGQVLSTNGVGTTTWVDNTELTTINNQTGTAYTLLLTDINAFITMDNAAANTVTIPDNATVAFPIGATLKINMLGVGITSISITNDTVNAITNGVVTTLAQYQVATLTKIAATVWNMSVA